MAQSQPTFGIQERWEHYLRRTYSWQRMGLMGVDVAADMVVSKPAGGRSTECFNDRYAGAFFRRARRTSVELVAGAAQELIELARGVIGYFFAEDPLLGHVSSTSSFILPRACILIWETRDSWRPRTLEISRRLRSSWNMRLRTVRS